MFFANQKAIEETTKRSHGSNPMNDWNLAKWSPANFPGSENQKVVLGKLTLNMQ